MPVTYLPDPAVQVTFFTPAPIIFSRHPIFVFMISSLAASDSELITIIPDPVFTCVTLR